MKFATHLADLSYPGGPDALLPTLTTLARTADQGGFNRITMMDHWFQMEPLGGPAHPMLEGYTSLGYLAGQTSKVDLGLLVTGVTYRWPGLLAKIIATLDVLSEGRAFCGVGAAWYDREHRGLGVPFPSTSERFEQLEETLQILRRMWSDDDSAYAGKHHQLAEPVCLPKPRHQPEIMIGGMGEKKTLRLVAEYGDACNLFPVGYETLKHKLEVLDGHCADVGRDPKDIMRTVMMRTDALAEPDDFRRELDGYIELGFGMVWVGPPWRGDDPIGWMERFCEQRLPEYAAL